MVHYLKERLGTWCKPCFQKKYIFFIKIIFLYVLDLFLCIDLKNNFLKLKNIILIYFCMKNT